MAEPFFGICISINTSLRITDKDLLSDSLIGLINIVKLFALNLQF